MEEKALTMACSLSGKGLAMSSDSVAQFPPPEAILPHRPPFLFLDKVLTCTEEEITGEYTFRDNDFFAGHFPERPIVPGVILLEGMAQALAYLALKQLGGGSVLLTGFESAKIRRPVIPGETVLYTVKIETFRHRMVIAKGRITVNGQPTAEARLKGFVES